MDVEDQIPPTLPLQKGGIPLFGKEGLGEIFTTICLFNYGLLSNCNALSSWGRIFRFRRQYLPAGQAGIADATFSVF